MIMMRTICITVFVTIAYFKNVETTSTSASTTQSESTSDSSIDTTEAISTMKNNDGTTISPSSENTTPSSSESTVLPTTANVTSTESSTEFFSSTLTDESSMSTTTEEKTTLSVTAGSSTTDVTTTYTTETDTSADTTTTINEKSEPTATTNPEVTSTTDSLTTEKQGTGTTDSSATEKQGTGTTEYSNTPTGSTHSTATTTHLATEETTDDETSTIPESTVDGTSSEPSINVTTSTEEATSSIRTTTMTPTSTTPSNNNDRIPVDTANAVMTVSLEVIFTSCVSEQDANQNMSVALSEINGFISVVNENSESDLSCTRDTNRRKITFKVFFMARVLLEDRENITSKINSTVGSISSVKSLLAFKMPDDMCHSDVCREALLEHKGYNCESDSPDGNCSLVSPCHNLSCKNGGTCTVHANRTHYNSVCKCKEDDMYSFSGIKCENKTISWKLWTIIAAGAGGGIIVVLLFAVVIICAKRKSMSSKAEVYGYDMGYDDRENLMFEPYHSSNENHRKPLSKGDRLEQTNLQTFDNQGYDQWDPSKSKDTYASMDRHFQSPSFQTQITRPTIKTNKGNDDQLTPF